MSEEKIKLYEIEDGDKLEQLIELLPFLLKLEKHKNRLLDVTPPTGSKIISAELEK